MAMNKPTTVSDAISEAQSLRIQARRFIRQGLGIEPPSAEEKEMDAELNRRFMSIFSDYAGARFAKSLGLDALIGFPDDEGEDE